MAPTIAGATVYLEYGGSKKSTKTGAGGDYSFDEAYAGGPATLWVVVNGAESDRFTCTPASGSTVDYYFYVIGPSRPSRDSSSITYIKGTVYYGETPVAGAVGYMGGSMVSNWISRESGSYQCGCSGSPGSKVNLSFSFNGIHSDYFVTTVWGSNITHDFVITPPAGTTDNTGNPTGTPSDLPGSNPSDASATDFIVYLDSSMQADGNDGSGQAATPTGTTGPSGSNPAGNQGGSKGSPFPGALVTLLAITGGCAFLYRLKK